MITLGIDLGSRSVKLAMFNNDEPIMFKKFSTMDFYKRFCNYSEQLSVNFKLLGIDEPDIKISTGYGRNSIKLDGFTPINELKAHTYGTIFQSGIKTFNLLDIGGQDVKFISVNNGVMTDMELNEKCAASCGRYLENMAQILEVSLEDLGNYHLDPVELSSTCAVFTESELIGQIARGVKLESLYAGVNHSLFKRIKPLIKYTTDTPLILSGGVSKNSGIKKLLKAEYPNLTSLSKPQYNGAIGCCYFGRRTNV